MAFGGSEWITRVQADCFIQSMTLQWKVIDNRFYDHSLCLTHGRYWKIHWYADADETV